MYTLVLITIITTITWYFTKWRLFTIIQGSFVSPADIKQFASLLKVLLSWWMYILIDLHNSTKLDELGRTYYSILLTPCLIERCVIFVLNYVLIQLSNNYYKQKSKINVIYNKVYYKIKNKKTCEKYLKFALIFFVFKFTMYLF